MGQLCRMGAGLLALREMPRTNLVSQCYATLGGARSASKPHCMPARLAALLAAPVPAALASVLPAY